MESICHFVFIRFYILVINSLKTMQKCNIKICTEGHQHLNLIIGSKQFSENYISSLMAQWCDKTTIIFNYKDPSAGGIFCIYIRTQTQAYILHENYSKHWKLHVTFGQSHQTNVDTSFTQWFPNIRRAEKSNSTSL